VKRGFKRLVIAISALSLAGCSTPRQPSPVIITAERATTVARQFANEKAATLYGTQPFQDGAAARLVEGQWVWSDSRPCGKGDMEAKVILAADGSPQSVDVVLLIGSAPSDF